jgi:predicted porin
MFNLGKFAMKKSLIALAVLGLSSAAAMAQSSVTLYGVADAGVGKIAAGNAFSSPRSKSSRASVLGGMNDNTNKTQFTSGSLMNNGTSRWGIRGVEDVGAGNHVGFNFESGVDLDDGAGGSFARQANMWIDGRWGTAKLGRQFTPSYLAIGTYELTGQANYSVVGNTYKYAGLTQRADSAFAYITPTFAGLTAAVAYVSKNDYVNLSTWDAAVLYSNGPIAAGASINKVKTAKTGYQIGGKYTFGHYAVAASYTQVSNVGSAVVQGPAEYTAQTTNAVQENPLQARRRGFGLGSSANFGPFTATVDLTRDTKNEWASGSYLNADGVTYTNNKKYTNGVVEVKYALSKRTFLYGAYLRLDSTNNYGLGMSHSF